MRRFACEGEMTVLSIKLRAMLHQLGDVVRPLLDQRLHGFGVAESSASIERILIMKLYRVIVAQDDGDPTLRVFCVRFGDLIFCKHSHTPESGERNRSAQPGDAAADDDKISLFSHFFWSLPPHILR